MAGASRCGQAACLHSKKQAKFSNNSKSKADQVGQSDHETAAVCHESYVRRFKWIKLIQRLSHAQASIP